VTRGFAFRASYAAAKAALESLTRTMAVELAPDGITANAIAPGPTETELFRDLPDSDQSLRLTCPWSGRVPQGHPPGCMMPAAEDYYCPRKRNDFTTISLGWTPAGTIVSRPYSR
ncbi:MAG TPA: SDR family oxidoreductase, partial [Sphingomicrobium sp.]|nr:SDR family oxidoreductase [Sphingomicrobium sp.]